MGGGKSKHQQKLELVCLCVRCEWERQREETNHLKLDVFVLYGLYIESNGRDRRNDFSNLNSIKYRRLTRRIYPEMSPEREKQQQEF